MSRHSGGCHPWPLFWRGRGEHLYGTWASFHFGVAFPGCSPCLPLVPKDPSRAPALAFPSPAALGFLVQFPSILGWLAPGLFWALINPPQSCCCQRLLPTPFQSSSINMRLCFPADRYEDAIEKYKAAMKTEPSVEVYTTKAKVRICHCLSKVSQAAPSSPTLFPQP